MASKSEKLIKAAERVDFRRVEELIRKGADANGMGKEGYTALDAVLSNMRFFKTRVEKGKLIKERAYPLRDIQTTVRLLLQAGADPNQIRDDCGAPITSAAIAGHLPMLKMWVKAGGDPNLQDAVGETPLVWGIYSRRLEVVQYLLDQGANPRLKDQEGKSALDIVKKSSRDNPKECRICDLIQRAAAAFAEPARAGETQPEQGPKLGIRDFLALMKRSEPEWSLFAVRAPAVKVAQAYVRLCNAIRCVKEVKLRPTKLGSEVARLTVVAGVKNNPWTVVLRSLFNITGAELDAVPEETKALSSRLKTRAIYFMREDTAGGMGYGIYDQGRLMEEADWESGGPFRCFHSKLRETPQMAKVREDFADDVFRGQGVYVPACYPRSTRDGDWLAVDECSKETIARADLIEPRSIARPSKRQQALDRLKAKLAKFRDKTDTR